MREADRATRRRVPAAERREHLLATAADLILESGLAEVSMESVAQAAGVSKALGYAHFKNLDDLLLALYDRELGLFYEDAEQAIAGSEVFEERIDAVVEVILDYVEKRGILFVLLRARLSQAAIPSGKERLGAWEAMLHGVVRDEVDLPPRELRAVVTMMLAASDGATRAWGPSKLSRTELGAACRACLIAGPLGVARS